ncbi:MAG TPA: cytochrome ubiquinol oxidase subunit I [Candidatus Cybelea sp.]|jgi:cytochrome d ubiquinol oxidase subunit I
MDVVIADRLQFAFTVMFHYLFPIATIGLAPFIAWFTYKAWRVGDGQAARIAAFWTKIFAINFAAGVVTGIPMEFQFGTNWGVFSAATGGVIGQPLVMEGIYAFFLESIFLGILLYGKAVVSPALYVLSAFLVWLGSWLSAYLIIVTDAWMQHPVGYAITNGRIEMRSLPAVLVQPFALWQFTHVTCGAMVAGSFIVAGVGAYYLLALRDEDYGRRLVRAGTLVGIVFGVLTVFPTGDRNGDDVTAYQPVKLAAMEGLFRSTVDAPLALIGMPDADTKSLTDPVYVPDLLSFLAYGNFRANVRGLTAYTHALWPPVALVYYAYHVMVGLGTILVGVMALATLLLWRGLLFKTRWVLWLVMLLMPFPYVANEAGWVVTEVGRQPWIVYGLMKTSQAASSNVATDETIFTIIGFCGMYFILGVLFLYLTLREIGIGPGRKQPGELSEASRA